VPPFSSVLHDDYMGVNMDRSPRLSLLAMTALIGAVLPFAAVRSAENTAQEKANMQIVKDFYAALEARSNSPDPDPKPSIREIAAKYMREDYIQHMDSAQPFGQGSDGFVRMSESVRDRARSATPAVAPVRPGPPKTLALTAEGDLVLMATERSMPNADGKGSTPGFIFNMFRVKDGKLAEHWDASTAVMKGALQATPAAAAPGR
jgi:predicted SnoaL-like aldol condensation-catalyzing enzyme